MAALDMYTEVNSDTNLPAQIEIYAEPDNEYRLWIGNAKALVRLQMLPGPLAAKA
jgi:hypothetical protein